MIRKGDILTFGEQRLMCGDCRDPAQVARLLGDVKPAIMFTSPPYLSQRVYAEAIGEWLPMMVQATLAPQMADDAQLFVNLGPCYKDGEWAPYWEPWLQEVRKHEWRRYQVCIWSKGYGTPGEFKGRMAPSFEFVFLLNKKHISLNKTLACKYKGEGKKTYKQQPHTLFPRGKTRTKTQTQPFKIPNDVVIAERCKQLNINHPARMPPGVAMHFLNAYARPRGTVYEPFCGSGTTLLAAHRLGLRGYGMEQSPEYCEIAAERLAKEMT